jgi:hypothetical protein
MKQDEILEKPVIQECTSGKITAFSFIFDKDYFRSPPVGKSLALLNELLIAKMRIGKN